VQVGKKELTEEELFILEKTAEQRIECTTWDESLTALEMAQKAIRERVKEIHELFQKGKEWKSNEGSRFRL